MENSENTISEEEQILEKMKEICTSKGFFYTENSKKIARAKKALFGMDEWYRCPCDSKNGERFCISSQCQKDIQENGICHCNCYRKEKE